MLLSRLTVGVGCRMFSSSAAPPLSSIVHLEKMMEESPKTLKKTWLRHHMKQDLIASVLETDSYRKLRERTLESSHFVFPLPSKDGKGFRSVYFQANGTVQLYTELEQFKKLGAAAKPVLSCVFYEELMEKKGLVLMRGLVNLDLLTPHDAAFLANQTTIWYFDDDRYMKHVRTFNHKPAEFNYDKVVEAMNTL